MAHRPLPDQKSDPVTWRPTWLFYVGLAIVLLAPIIPLNANWYTFIHMWRVEIAASVFLGTTLIYLLLNGSRFSFRNEIYSNEWKFIVLPIVIFILWSSLSALWAPSWKSALHHSLIWAEYLVFYLIFRHVLSQGSGFRKLVMVFVSTLGVYALLAIVEYCMYLSMGGPTTLGIRYAKFGEQIVTLLPIVLLLVVRTRGKQFVIGATAVTLLWLLIFCSLGRVNYLLVGCVIAGTLAALLISKRHRRYVSRFALLTLLLILAPIPLHLFSMSSPDAGVPIISRLNDTDRISSSNNVRKLMFTISDEMIRANPLIGVGADNFGMQFNHYRAKYGAANPADVNLAYAEDEIPGHAHNEMLQIATELGIIGGGVMLWLLFGIGIMAFRAMRDIRSGSLLGLVAIIGLAMFLTSSLVSSYSFRVMQNGIVFFFVLAVAAKMSFKEDQSESDARLSVISRERRRLCLAAGLVVCFGLLIYSGVRIGSVIVAVRANQARSFESAMPLYELAMQLDNENPDARQNLGLRLFQNRRYKEAIPYFQSAISIGRAPSADFSTLAAAKTLAGDNHGAEETLASAASLYPRSPFVLTRYATLLENNGKIAESDEAFARAVMIDQRAANTWRTLMVSGPKAISEIVDMDVRYAHVRELRPKGSVYPIITERLLSFPEERQFAMKVLSSIKN